MIVSEMMTAKPVTILQDQPLRRAIEIMEDGNFHHLPVINMENQLVGIITERDCLAALNLSRSLRDLAGAPNTRKAAAAPASSRTPVRTVMTPAPIVVEPHADADEAARLMLTNHIGCLPVMRSETLVGIITTSDVLIAFMTLYKRLRDLHPEND
jgi:CBS domain-containing protein